ncbi:MAG: hypothetical protein AAFZ65_07760 [Planctomycetota bacterium]
MDFDEYWQENKDFVAKVAIGLIVFLIGTAVVGRTVGSKVDAERGAVRRERAKLRQEAFAASDEDHAREDNRALTEAVEALASRVRYVPSEALRAPDRPTTSEVYLAAVARVRDELLPAAGRANVRLDSTFGLPQLSPTREDELERYLDGLDLVVRVLRIAIDEEVDEVRNTRIKLDTTRRGGEGRARIERTSVEFDMLGDNTSLVRLLTRTQSEIEPPLVVEEVQLDAERGGGDEARLRVTFLTPRLEGAAFESDDRNDGGMP